MPIKSYLAFPKPGRYPHMLSALEQCDGLELYPSENRELAVVVTDSATSEQEQSLETELAGIEDIQCLAMVFGHAEPTSMEV
ncbi:hypothetical protein SCOR_07820 [Sulfidibacter corallicola]|uniref:Chaperone NapD n=1 Tax=Sulfidibacter corallicola TaxID=2818388 RepID=A0A8A4TMW0_SULCO|nr:hypothetical protein [Sulfidibacter corallicola]QTD51329.1 hypothetical protein J3U87_02575 [Sulfidibacter corallicola]